MAKVTMKRGRKSLSGEGRTYQMTIPIPELLHDKLKRLATEEGVSKGAWVRRAISSAEEKGSK